MTNSPLPDPIPRYVIFRKRRVRVLGYEDNKFTILDHNDQKHWVTRDRITFIKTS